MRQTEHGIRPRARLGFALIELLVVAAILAVLIGLLLPVLKMVKGRGNKTSCLSNLRQLGIAVNAYTADSSGHLPMCQRVVEAQDDPTGVFNVLEISSAKVFLCPADTEPMVDGRPFHECYHTSYEWNAWLSGRFIDQSDLSVQQLRITMPVMGDGADFHGRFGRNYLYVDGHVAPSLEVKIE